MFVCGCVSSRKYKPDSTRESVVGGEVGDIAPCWFDLSPELNYLVMRCCNAVYFLGVRRAGKAVAVSQSHSPSVELSSAQNYDAVKSVVRERERERERERCSWCRV